MNLVLIALEGQCSSEGNVWNVCMIWGPSVAARTEVCTERASQVQLLPCAAVQAKQCAIVLMRDRCNTGSSSLFDALEESHVMVKKVRENVLEELRLRTETRGLHEADP